MWPLFQKVVDSVFPPSADELLVRRCTHETIDRLYQPTNRDGVVILLPYQDPTVRALIHLAKFQYHHRSYHLLAHILTKHLKIAAATPHWLVPIPLSKRRWRDRGYNQVYEVAKRTARTVSVCTLTPRLLRRSRHTTPQTDLNRRKRLTNVVGAFTCRVQPRQPTAVLILDDVCTTGSTLSAAQAAIKNTYPNTPIVRLALAG